MLNSNASLKEIIDTFAQIDSKIIDRGGARTINPSTSNQTLLKGNYKGDITISGDPNLISQNIKVGTSIFGVNGSLQGTTECYSDGNSGMDFLNPFSLQIDGDYDRFESYGDVLRLRVFGDSDRKITSHMVGMTGTMHAKIEGSRYSNVTLNVKDSNTDGVLFSKSLKTDSTVEFDFNVKKDSYIELIIGKHNQSVDLFYAILVSIKYQLR